MPHPIGVLSQSILYPFSISHTCSMSFLKLAQKCVLGRTCPGHVPDMSWTCTQNFPVLTILGHLQKCPESIFPMSFFYFSNLSHVLAQNFLKMGPRPDMSRTRPWRVPDVSSKYPCPDYFGTSSNRTSATKLVTSIKTVLMMTFNDWRDGC